MFRRLAVSPLAFVIFGVAAVTPTYADAIQLTSPAQLNPGGFITEYPGATGATLLAPLIVTAGSTTVTFTVAVGNTILRLDQCPGPDPCFAGDFNPGTQLLLTALPTNAPTGPLTINFGLGVIEFGLDAQNNFVGNGLFTFSVFNGARLLRTFTQPGDGFTSFLGARATGGDIITRVIIGGSSSDPDPDAQNSFAIGPVTSQPIPEPATFLLLGTGLASISAMVCRRKIRERAKTRQNF